MKDILCIFWENFELGGVTSHLEILLNNKKFLYRKIIIYTNHDNKALIYLKKKIKKKNVYFFTYRNLNCIYFRNIFLKAIYHFVRPILFFVSIFYFFNKLKKVRNTIFLANCGGYGNFRSEMAAILSAYLLGNKKIYLLIHHCFTKPIIWNFLIQLVNFLISKIVQKIIYVSNATKLDINENVPFFRKERKNLIIYNGIKVSKFDRKKISIFKKYKSFIKIGMLSRIEPLKGQFELVNILKKINKKLLNKIRIFLIGNGDKNYILELKNEIKKFKLENKIILTNFLKYDSRQIVLNLDLLLSLNQKFEGFGYSHVEAASLGIPVLVTDVGAAKEIFGKNSSVLVNVNNTNLLISSLEKFIKNKSTYVKYAKKIQQRIIKKFDENLMIEKFIKNLI